MKNIEIKIEELKKIAIIRTDRLGDMVLTLPMFKAIKYEYPNIETTIIANTYTKPLLQNCKYINSIFYVDEFENGINEIFKKNHFDIVFFPRPRFDESLAAYRYKIPIRVGTGYRLYSFLFNHKVYDHRKISEYHEAEYNVRQVESVFQKKLNTELIKPYVNFKDLFKVDKLLKESGFDENQKSIILHPGSRASAKDWDSENFGKVGQKLVDTYGFNIIITGTESEKSFCQKAGSQCLNAINLCGKLNLYETIALISRSDLLISNSTGVLHIAAALGINVIGLYPNTLHISAKRWGPYTKKAIVLSPPINESNVNIDDMSLIKIDDVFNSVIRLLSI